MDEAKGRPWTPEQVRAFDSNQVTATHYPCYYCGLRVAILWSERHERVCPMKQGPQEVN